MSFTIVLPQKTLKIQSLPFKIFNLNFTTNQSQIIAESFYTSTLNKCITKTQLNQVHTQLYVHGLQKNGFIITKLIHVCSNVKQVNYARQVFDVFPQPYVFLWNAIIRGYSVCNMQDKVIEMFSRMQHSFVAPDKFTFPYVLKACGSLLRVGIGRAVQGQIFRRGFDYDEFLQNGLVSFYVNCGENRRALVVFNKLEKKCVVSWTSIISGFTNCGRAYEALGIFREMRGTDVKPDWITLVSVLKAYSDVQDLKQGGCVHGLVIKFGLEFETDLGVALVSMYAKCGEVMTAKSLFDGMKVCNVVLLNAMISGFAKSGHAVEALELFEEMSSKGMKPDAVTLQSSVLACAQLGSFERARTMGDYVNSSDSKDDVIVNTALIDMYSKCGGVELARQVFNQIVNKDVFVWSAMITGYGLNGHGREAINLFKEMNESGFRPNDVTFTGLITACSHSGLVQEGWEIFHGMKEFGVEPSTKHYSGVVDMLGRAGFLKEACQFIMDMPLEPGVSVWGALLSGCKMHRSVILGEYAAERLFALDPLNIGHYVQLSNLYAEASDWDGVERVRTLLQSRGLEKELGYSECLQIASDSSCK